MNIIETNLSFGSLSYGNKPNSIVLHHAEWSKCSVEDIHRLHKDNFGWSGIGYHYFVRKDGSIYRGRPENAIGAHAKNHNTNTLGICAEGAYTKEIMPEAQKKSIIELGQYLKNKHGINKIYGHKELMSTDCPGANYPLQEIRDSILSSVPQPTPTPSRFPLPLQMSEDAMVYDNQINMFNKGDKLTSDAENKYAYAIELEGERCWILKDDVRKLKNLDYPYESRFYLECIEDNVRAWGKEIRTYLKNDYITVRDEISGYYFIDTGENGTGWVKKSSTKNR